jgi:hypothetical protein
MILSLALTFMFVATLSMIGRPEASAASSLQTSAEQTGVEVFTSPDESSLVLEAVKDG